jgi:hypothetical protein
MGDSMPKKNFAKKPHPRQETTQRLVTALAHMLQCENE